MGHVLRTLPLLLALAASACSLDQNPLYRPGTWRPEGLNQRNLQAMLADPNDLQAGAAGTTDRGSGASRAVTRLLIDRRRPLLNTMLSRIGGQSQETPDAPLPAAGAGAPAAVGATP